jgi:5'-3' exonuclease
MNTLLVDGNNLLTIGFYGCKNFFYKGVHIGGIYHFLNTIRKSIEAYNLDKVVVFWDGENNADLRRQVYHLYKSGNKNNKTEKEEQNFNYQKRRIQKYLEELYIRQGEYEFCESDDCIAYYVHNSLNEKKIIYSSDRDLPQLLDENTKIFNPSLNNLYSLNDTIVYKKQEILINNVALVKMLCGDESDGIYGIYSLGIKSLIDFFPEIKTTPLTLTDIKEKANLLFEENKHNKKLANLLTGVTKYGVLGDEFFELNYELIDLTEPKFLTEEAKLAINSIIHENLDSEGRSYKNMIQMMTNDGVMYVLPKYGDGWIDFLTPFLKLIRKEKNNNIKEINNNYARTRFNKH